MTNPEQHERPARGTAARKGLHSGPLAAIHIAMVQSLLARTIRGELEQQA
jgi:hypothetical protein